MERDDDLINLLRRADEDASRPSPAGDVASRVRRRHTRRRRVRAVAASMAGAAAVVLVVLGLSRSPVDDVQPPRIASVEPVAKPKVVSLAAIQGELDQLQRECDRREITVARMLESERRRSTSFAFAASARIDPILDLALQREQAALVLVRQGDRLANDLALPQSAAVAYRQARDTFPGTSWAAVADSRLTMPN